MLAVYLLIVTNLATLIAIGWFYRKTKQVKYLYSDLQNRYRVNPSYDCQQMMAELLTDKGLFRIELVEREDLLLRRR